MVAEGVRDTELADYQRAVRTLLVNPLITEVHPDRTALTLIRRFAVPLSADLDRLAGYRLELAPTCARLVRRIDRLDDTQATVRRRDRRPFDRRRYAYLALVVAALGRAGAQIALTELAGAVKRRAADIDGLGFDPDEYRHRLAFVEVVRHLLELGALREVETSAVEWVRDPDAGEALYDVDRDVLHLLFVPPRVIQHVRSAASLLTADTAASRDTRRAETRQRLVRLLLEHPVVYLDDLDDAARGYLASQARVLADDLHRLTGGQLERRVEGVALVDATGGFSDRRFPTAGTAAQVALLLADAMAAAVTDEQTAGQLPVAAVPRVDDRVAALVDRLDAVRPTAPVALADEQGLSAHGQAALNRPTPTEDPAGARSAPLFTTTWLRDRAEQLTQTYGRAFAADLRDDPDALATAAVEVLADFDLVRRVPGGVVARPALARFREVTVQTATSAQAATSAQPSLLDTPNEVQT